MALKEEDLSDDICVQPDTSKAAYPIHQLINVLSIESMIDELYESVCPKAAEQIVIKLPLLLSVALGILE